MTESDAIEELADLLDGIGDRSTAPSSLASLVQLAETVTEQRELIAPAADFRASLRAEIVAAGTPAPTLAERTKAAWVVRTNHLRSSTRIAVATMTASSMLGSAGMAMAAQEALPGDMLYGLKGMTEQARLLLATDDLAEARLHLAFARERLEELQAMAGELTTDEIIALLARMDESSRAGAEALMDGAAGGTIDLAELAAFTSLQRDGLLGLLNDLPLLAKPVAEGSIELLRRIEINAIGIVPSGSAVDLACDCDDFFSQPSGSITGSRSTSPSARLGSGIAAPGEGKAVNGFDCDCIKLPGGDRFREPLRPGKGTRSDSGSTPSTPPTDGTDEERESPFENDGPLSNPKTDGDDGESKSSIRVGDSMEQLPIGDVADLIGGTTGITADTSAVDRTADAADVIIGDVGGSDAGVVGDAASSAQP